MAMVDSYVLVLIQCPDKEWNGDIHDNEDWAWQSAQKCLSAGFALRNLPNQNLQRAFYVAGGAAVDHNSLLELDNCIVYTVEHDDKPKYGQFLLQVEMSVNVDLEFLSLCCHVKMAMMQLQVSQLPPVRPDSDILNDTEPFDSGTCRVHRTVLVDGTPVTDFLPFATWDRDAPWIRRGRCVCRHGVGSEGARCNRNCYPGIFCDCCLADRCACSCAGCDPSSTSSGDSSEDDYDFEFPWRFG